jgi:hypothetical protein
MKLTHGTARALSVTYPVSGFINIFQRAENIGLRKNNLGPQVECPL